jgi:hypothetical protein
VIVEFVGESVGECVAVDADAPSRIRAAFGLPPDGDCGSPSPPARRRGRHVRSLDGRALRPAGPVIAYSTQLYTLLDKIDAEALILCEPETLPSSRHPRIRFVRTPRRQQGLGRIAYRIEAARFVRRVLRETRGFDPDVVLLGGDAPVGLLRGLPARVRVVMTLHNTFWPMGRRPRSLPARLKLARTARALGRLKGAVCTSRSAATSSSL